MPKQETIFRISGYNRGVACPFLATVCPGGYCHQCPIYLDWQERGEMVLICMYCGTVKDRKPGIGRPVVSHGICLECQGKYFPIGNQGGRDVLEEVNVLEKEANKACGDESGDARAKG